MSIVRLRRLTADHARLRDYTKNHPRLKLIQADGDPPERYQIEFRVRSLRQVDGTMRVIKSHTVEILLPRNYPRTPPQCRMLTPVFHPNIAPHAICVGDHWSPGESLESLVSRIGEMLAYQSYNVKSPLNGEAARWVAEHEDELPLDPVSMLIDESRAPAMPNPATAARTKPSAASPIIENQAETYGFAGPDSESSHAAAMPQQSDATQPGRQPASPERSSPSDQKPGTLLAQCPACHRRYRVPLKAAGRKANCAGCDHVFQIPLPPDSI